MAPILSRSYLHKGPLIAVPMIDACDPAGASSSDAEATFGADPGPEFRHLAEQRLEAKRKRGFIGSLEALLLIIKAEHEPVSRS